MPSQWHKHDAGLFRVEFPPNWVADQPHPGTLLLRDPDSGLSMAFVGVSREAHPDTPSHTPPMVEAQFELKKWIDTQRNVQVPLAPRSVPNAPFATATTEGLQPPRSGGKWYQRLLGGWRQGMLHWRFWAVLNSHLVVLVSCHGKPSTVEKQRPILDRLIASLHLPERDLLTGRRFTETVVSLARSWFPRTAVEVIDDAHLQFGPRNIALDNLHRRYLASPEQLSTHVRALLTQVQEAMPASAIAESWSHAKEHVMPTFLMRDTLNNAKGRVVHEEWINGLFMAYVMEEQPAENAKTADQRQITIDDLARWNVTPEELHEQALKNLVVFSRDQIMEGRKEPGCTILTLARPDRHNAARILLPELHRQLREHLGNTFFAAIPTREKLKAFNVSDEKMLERVRVEIERDFNRAKEGISPKIFLVTSDGIAGDPQSEPDA